MSEKTSTQLHSVESAEKLVDENPLPPNGKRPRPTVVLVEGRACISVPLTKGKWAIVDCEDFPLVSRFNWHVSGNPGEEYAARRICKFGPIVYMHREILNHDEPQTDHRNRCRLDNRRCNIRPASHTENGANKGPMSKSGFKGVSFSKGRFHAFIKNYRKSRHLGAFILAEDAARQYDLEAKKVWGEFAVLNFPELAETEKAFPAPSPTPQPEVSLPN